MRRFLTQPWVSLGVRLAAASTAMFCLAFLAFTYANDFPIHYHPDEMSKVDQVMDPRKYRNFHHPLLLIELTDRVRSIGFPGTRDDQDVVRVGRSVSAFLGAVVVVALGLCGYLRLGWVGFWAISSSLIVCQSLLVHAHYLKEDVAMAAGMSVVMLGIAALSRTTRPWQLHVGLLIAACGVAVAASSKYVGVVFAVPVILAVAMTRSGWKTWIHLLLVTAVAAVLWMGINGRMFTSFLPPNLDPEVTASGRDELHSVTLGREGMTLRRPNTYVLYVAAGTTAWPLWGFLAGGAYLFFRRREGTFRWWLPISMLTVLVVVVLANTALPFSRYALPVGLLIAFFASYSAAMIILSARSRIWAAAAVGAMAITLAFQAQRCWAVTKGFQLDSRQQLRTWIAWNMRPFSLVVAEGYTGLANPGDRRYPAFSLPPLLMRHYKYAASAGPTVKELAKRGVKYVIVTTPAYGRFFVREIDSYDEPVELKRKQAFYTDLFQLGKVVWESPSLKGETGYTSPKISVVDISALGNPAENK